VRMLSLGVIDLTDAPGAQLARTGRSVRDVQIVLHQVADRWSLSGALAWPSIR